MKEAFISRSFRADTLGIIESANRIIREYQAKGFTLTLRQLYYQFVARGMIPNRQSEYKRLGSIVNDGRLAGLIDWDAIEDRTRNIRKPNTWDSPAAIINAIAEQYQEDIWANQKYRPEVWIEKDALVGVVEPVCLRWFVPFFACRGYSSQSETYSAGVRFRNYRRRGLTPIVLHLGDHDPSGIDMTRDNADRLAMFARSGIEVRRLALNWEQVEQYDPPPNPAKESDSRHAGYQAKFGDESWELDALDPTVIDDLISTELGTLVDADSWEADVAASEENRLLLQKVSDNWTDVVSSLS